MIMKMPSLMKEICVFLFLLAAKTNQVPLTFIVTLIFDINLNEVKKEKYDENILVYGLTFLWLSWNHHVVKAEVGFYFVFLLFFRFCCLRKQVSIDRFLAVERFSLLLNTFICSCCCCECYQLVNHCERSLYNTLFGCPLKCLRHNLAGVLFVVDAKNVKFFFVNVLLT